MEIERQLVRRVLAGDPSAEEEFYSAMRPRLLRASKYFLGYDDSDAEDVVQETFIIAFPKLKDFTFEAPIYAWLRQICLRQSFRRLRARKRLMAKAEEDIEAFMQALAMEKCQEEACDLRLQEQLALLQQIKKGLGPDNRQIIELKYVRGMSYAKIGQQLMIPIGTVMSRLARARDRMRSLAEEVVDEEAYA